MSLDTTARDLMHQHTFVSGDMTVKDVAVVMSQKRIGSVLVKTRRGLGIVTERDVSNKVLVEGKDPCKMKAKDIMTFPVTTVSGNTGVYEICRLFSENNFRRLPVVENGEVIGILTTRDIVRQFIPKLFKDTYHFKDFRF